MRKYLILFLVLNTCVAFSTESSDLQIGRSTWRNDLNVCPKIEAVVNQNTFIKEAYVTSKCDEVLLVPKQKMYGFAFFDPAFDDGFSREQCRTVKISEDIDKSTSYLYELKMFRYSHGVGTELTSSTGRDIKVKFPAGTVDITYNIARDKRTFKIESLYVEKGMGRRDFMLYAPTIVRCDIHRFIPDGVMTYSVSVKESIVYYDSVTNSLKEKDVFIDSEVSILSYERHLKSDTLYFESDHQNP